MSKKPSIEETADEIVQALLSAPKHRKWLRSTTFWADFVGTGHKRMTDKVDHVKDALTTRGVLITVDKGEFGAEPPKAKIVLTLVSKPNLPSAPVPGVENVLQQPPDDWFDRVQQLDYGSEREVEYRFIMPFVEHLGYREADVAIGHPVQMYEGVKKVKKEADVVLFEGQFRGLQGALVVVEAKSANHPVTEDAAGQAKSYALSLTAPYYVVTNGLEIRLYHCHGAMQPDVLLLSCSREQLRDKWASLSRYIRREAVVAYKANLKRVIESADQ